MVELTWKNGLVVSLRVKYKFIYDPPAPLLGMYQEKPAHGRQKTCTRMFRSSTIYKSKTFGTTFETSQCLSSEEWLHELGYIHTVECNRALQLWTGKGKNGAIKISE